MPTEQRSAICGGRLVEKLWVEVRRHQKAARAVAQPPGCRWWELSKASPSFHQPPPPFAAHIERSCGRQHAAVELRSVHRQQKRQQQPQPRPAVRAAGRPSLAIAAAAALSSDSYGLPAMLPRHHGQDREGGAVTHGCSQQDWRTSCACRCCHRRDGQQTVGCIQRRQALHHPAKRRQGLPRQQHARQENHQLRLWSWMPTCCESETSW